MLVVVVWVTTLLWGDIFALVFLNSVFDFLAGLGKSVESCALLNPPASSGLTSFLDHLEHLDSAPSSQTVICVWTGRLDLPYLERRDVSNESKK